jgi:hypothetical protein
MLQNDPLNVPPVHFDVDAVPDPAFHIDADSDPAVHFDADPDPASQLMRIQMDLDLDPDPQHCGSGSSFNTVYPSTFPPACFGESTRLFVVVTLKTLPFPFFVPVPV